MRHDKSAWFFEHIYYTLPIEWYWRLLDSMFSGRADPGGNGVLYDTRGFSLFEVHYGLRIDTGHGFDMWAPFVHEKPLRWGQECLYEQEWEFVDEDDTFEKVLPCPAFHFDDELCRHLNCQ